MYNVVLPVIIMEYSSAGKTNIHVCPTLNTDDHTSCMNDVEGMYVHHLDIIYYLVRLLPKFYHISRNFRRH